MNKAHIIISFLLASVLVAGLLVFLWPDSSDSNQTVDTSRVFSLAEVEKHGTENDCWTVIDGGVYDITSYIGRHPGGNEILRACGADSTQLFKTRTDTDGNPIGSGQPHSAVAEAQLEKMRIGGVSE